MNQNVNKNLIIDSETDGKVAFFLHMLDDLWSHLRCHAACEKFEYASTEPDDSSMFVALVSDAFKNENIPQF